MDKFLFNLKRSVLFLSVLLVGCATNPYKQFYTDNTGGIDPFKTGRAIMTTNDPQLIYVNTVDEGIQNMMEDGYLWLGYSSFNAGNIGQDEAITFGKEIHAEKILLCKEYKSTQSGEMPITLPNIQTSTTQGMGMVGGSPYSGSFQTTTYGTQTTDIPYQINMYSYKATYWIKAKLSRLGVIVRDLKAEERKKIGTNKGVFAFAIVKYSSAFKADLFKGDIILKIDDEDVLGPKEYGDILKEKQGKKVILTIIRDDKSLTKEVQLNSDNVEEKP